jgi:hypothetical protein
VLDSPSGHPEKSKRNKLGDLLLKFKNDTPGSQDSGSLVVNTSGLASYARRSPLMPSPLPDTIPGSAADASALSVEASAGAGKAIDSGQHTTDEAVDQALQSQDLEEQDQRQRKRFYPAEELSASRKHDEIMISPMWKDIPLSSSSDISAKIVPRGDISESGDREATSAETSGSPVTEVAGVLNFTSCKTAFAVDVSTSTTGPILYRETSALSMIYDLFDTRAKTEAKVLPWCGQALQPLSMKDLHKLKPKLGTEPDVLNRDPLHAKILQHSRLWFLFTDGFIEPDQVAKFAEGLCGNSMHGTACVIILFGHCPSRPLDCNISVGQAVFAVAPNCLFLYHAVGMEQLYLLQAKGCFKALLPKGVDELLLELGTSWDDLPRMLYSDLAQVNIPAPQKLGRDDILLHDNKIVNLEDLYCDRLEPGLTESIFEIDDDLKSILLNAHNRGRRNEVGSWVAKQRISLRHPLHIPRPDGSGRASELMQALLVALRAKHDVSAGRRDLLEDSGISELRLRLRIAHEMNWENFTRSIDIRFKHVADREEIVTNAMSRISMSEATPSSPALMSPLTHLLRSKPLAKRIGGELRSYVGKSLLQSQYPPGAYQLRRYTDDPCQVSPYPSDRCQPSHMPVPENQCYSPRQSLSKGWRSYPREPETSRSVTHVGSVLHHDPREFDTSHIIHTQRYIINRASTLHGMFRGLCSLCAHADSLLVLLFKKPPLNLYTNGFPRPGSRSVLAFPLAMGCFPETDIISSYICCDACSTHLVRLGKSPLDEEIVGSYPLLRRGQDENKTTWLETLDEAFQKRFNRSDIELVFLAVLHNTREYCASDSTTDMTLIVRALQWTFNDFMKRCRIQSSLNTPSSTPSTTPKSILIDDAIEPGVDSANEWLLQYPIEGFAVLLSFYKDSEPALQKKLKIFVHERFFFDITQHYYDNRVRHSPDVCAKQLSCLLTTPDNDCPGSTEGAFARTPRMSLRVSDLCENELIDPDEIDGYRQLSHLFFWLEHKGHMAILVYLHYLLDEASRKADARDCFTAIRGRSKLSVIFSAPGDVDSETALKLLQYCDSARAWTWTGLLPERDQQEILEPAPIHDTFNEAHGTSEEVLGSAGRKVDGHEYEAANGTRGDNILIRDFAP